MTPCECPVAGYCNRHRLRKNEHLHRLCSRDERYYAHWEKISQLAERPQPMLGCQYNHWMPLHNYAPKNWNSWNPMQARVWYRAWKRQIKNTGCGCAGNWKKEVAEIPVDFSSPKAFFEWSWKIHNAVNQRLGKSAQPTLEEAYSLWLPRESEARTEYLGSLRTVDSLTAG